MVESIQFRRASEADIRPILSLFKAVAPRYPRSELYYRWAHFLHPVKPSCIVVGELSGAIVAHVAVSAMALSDGRCAGFPQQVLIHPHTRGFDAILNLLREMNGVIQEHFDFGIGFPNRIFAPVLERLGRWSNRGQVADHVVDVVDNTENPYYFIPYLLGSRPDEKEGFHQKLWDSSASTTVVIDSRWFLWRYVDHPTEHYDVLIQREDGVITSYIVLKVFDREESSCVAHVLDARAIDSVSLQALEKPLRSFLHFQGVSHITTWSTCPAVDFLNQLFAKASSTPFEPVKTNLFFSEHDDTSIEELFMGLSDVY